MNYHKYIQATIFQHKITHKAFSLVYLFHKIAFLNEKNIILFEKSTFSPHCNMNLFIHALWSAQLRAIPTGKVVRTLYMLKLRLHRWIVRKNVKPFTCLSEATMRTLAHQDSSSSAILCKDRLNCVGRDHSIRSRWDGYSWSIVLIVKVNCLLLKHILLGISCKILLIVVLSSVIFKARLHLLMKKVICR